MLFTGELPQEPRRCLGGLKSRQSSASLATGSLHVAFVRVGRLVARMTPVHEIEPLCFPLRAAATYDEWNRGVSYQRPCVRCIVAFCSSSTAGYYPPSCPLSSPHSNPLSNKRPLSFCCDLLASVMALQEALAADHLEVHLHPSRIPPTHGGSEHRRLAALNRPDPDRRAL